MILILLRNNYPTKYKNVKTPQYIFELLHKLQLRFKLTFVLEQNEVP